MFRKSEYLRSVAAWLPAVTLMGLIFYFSSLPSYELPKFGLIDFVVKKGGHMVGYGLLALSYQFGFGYKQPRYKSFAFFMAVLYACSDEYHQSFVPGRGASIVDVGIDGLGAALALWGKLIWHRLFDKF